MRPHSKELAYRIDMMVAFQNDESIQYRHKSNPRRGWQDSPSQNLCFEFNNIEYRKKPVMIEGWIHPKHIHTPPPGGCAQLGCVYVRQVESGE